MAGETAGQAVEVEPTWRERLQDLKTLAATAKAMGDAAATLERDDVDALIARRQIEARSAAAPELRDTLKAIAAKHPDTTIRRRAARAATRLDLDAHLVELRRAAHALKAAGKRGVAIWTEVARRSVDHHKDRTDIGDAHKFDEVIADLAIVFNGDVAQDHLETYERWFGLLPGSDPNVDTMIRAVQRRDRRLGFAGRNIDPTAGADFRPGFRDGTNNQVFHTNFFVLLGYAAAKHDGRLVNAVNLKHETLDHLVNGEGGSVADWRASAAALRIGDSIRRVRDGESNNRTPREGLLAIPTLIGAAFGHRPLDHARPWGRTGPDYTKSARAVDRHIRETMHKPYGRNSLANNFQRGLIRLVRWIR